MKEIGSLPSVHPKRSRSEKGGTLIGTMQDTCGAPRRNDRLEWDSCTEEETPNQTLGTQEPLQSQKPIPSRYKRIRLLSVFALSFAPPLPQSSETFCFLVTVPLSATPNSSSVFRLYIILPIWNPNPADTLWMNR